jgi:hypothetical protein
LENCAIIRSPKVSDNNLPLAGNLQMQTQNKSESRVVILKDAPRE